MKEYYIAQNNEQRGPFSLEELKVSPTTSIWREGLSDWVEAKNVKELEILFKSTPPALPKKNDEKNLPQDKTLNVDLRVKRRASKPKSVVDEITRQKRKTIIAKEIKLAGKIFLYSIIMGLISYPFFAHKGFKALYLKNKPSYEVKDQIESLVPESRLGDRPSIFFTWEKDYGSSTYSDYYGSYSDSSEDSEINPFTGLPYGDDRLSKPVVPISEPEEDINPFTGKPYEKGTQKYQKYKNFDAGYSGVFTRKRIWRYTDILDYYIYKMKSTNIYYSVIVIVTSFCAILLGRFMYLVSKKGVHWVSENSKK